MIHVSVYSTVCRTLCKDASLENIREENAKTMRKALCQCLTKKFKHCNAGNTWLEIKILTLKRTNGETL